MLQTIHYPNEIRDITNTPNLPSNENYPIQKQELTAAINLIHHLTNPFEQEMYTDEYKEALTELIEEKIEQQEKTETISPAPNIINIMETLQASIEQAKIKETIKQKKRPNKIDLFFFKADYILAFRVQMIELILINNNIPLLPYDLPFSLIIHLILHSTTRVLPLHVKM